MISYHYSKSQTSRFLILQNFWHVVKNGNNHLNVCPNKNFGEKRKHCKSWLGQSIAFKILKHTPAPKYR